MRHTLVPGMEETLAASDASGALTGVSGRVYRLGAAPLGVGGQAEVWPAVDPDGVTVAVKLAHPGPGATAAIAQEAALLVALSAAGYRHAATCLDRIAGERTGFVMPLYPQDVDTHLRARAGDGIEGVLAVASALARALSELHAVELPGVEGRLVHRDVKPDNVLVDASGRVRLADFGGSLLVDGAPSLDAGVFGSPLWAPFDQMLPGLPEPNPTWDTYAACVMVFWWITGGRPAYQADPSPMLTERGRTIWAALGALADGEPSTRMAAIRAYFDAREGTRAAELVDVRGHGAIQEADRSALADGVRRLADPERYGEAALADAARDLADLLARGLSPLAHPSPPNRYWRAADLAAELDAIGSRLVGARSARAGEAERAGLRAQVDALSQPRRAPWRAIVAGGGALLLFGATFAWLQKPQPAPVAAAAAVASERALLLVPSGASTHGDAWGDGEPDERPARPVELPAFQIHRTEVSNAEYTACVAANVCAPLAWQDPASPYHLERPGGAPFIPLSGGSQPAVGVTWRQAATFCAWAGGRLPTEEEWEKAATAGLDGTKRRWPWGDDAPDCARANAAACGRGTTLPVDDLPAGASAFGAVQLTGNAWEWTSGTYTVVRRKLFRKTTEEHKVLRGGSFESTPEALRPTFRRHADPDTVSPLHGFRCAFSPRAG